MMACWIILLVFVWSETCIYQSIAQTTSTLSQYEGDTISLSCSLSGTFAFPEWQGPPSFTPYTILGDTTGGINPEAPAASRLQVASNKKSLILSNAVISDSGDYKCLSSGLGYHTITLTVNPATTGDDDNGLSTGAIVGIAIAVVVVVVVAITAAVVILAIKGMLPSPPEAPPEALIKYCVIIMEGILTWLLGASIGAFWVVTEVLPGGPADGKLKVGYKIYEINDKAVTEENHNKIEEMINDKEILTLRVSKDGIPDTSYVQLKCKKGELLGFKVEHLPMVTEVSDGSKADGKLEKGDRILSINGKSTTGKSIGDINKQLKIPPTVLDLSLKRGKEERNVTLDFKGKALSGIAIKKEKEDIVVSAIEPESAAESGDVKEQDYILSVNGVSTAGMKVGDIKDMLTFSIILKVTKDVTLKELDPDMDGSFGFETFPPSTSTSVAFNKQTTVTSVTPDRPANVVKSVTPNGPAARHGIKPGDTIVSINGKKTKGKSHQEIKAMLETFGTSISLKIAENDKPNQTNGHGGNDIEMGHVNPRAQDSGRVQTLETTEEKQDFMKPLLDDKC